MTAEVQLPASAARAASPRHGGGPVATALGVVVVTGAGLALWARAAAGPSVATAAELALVIGLVGSFIGWHRRGERIARLMAVTGLSFAVGVLAVGVLALAAGQADVPAAVQQAALLAKWLTVALPVPWALLVVWFPDGRFTHRGWARLVAVGGVVALAVAVLGYLFSPAGEVPGVFSGTPQPADLTGPYPTGDGMTLQAAGNAVAALPLLAVPALVGRFRGADPLVRQQVRWLLVGALGAIAGVAAATAVGNATLPGLVAALATQPLPSAAITVAILRYRLWDIDLVVSRAVVYAVLWAALSLLLLIPALVAGLFVGGTGALTAVGLALLVTVAFQPARARLDRVVERVAFRHRPRGYALLGRLGQQLRGGGDVGATVDGLKEGLGVSWAGIWARVELGDRQALRPLAVTAEGTADPAAVLSAELIERLHQATGPVERPPHELEDLWP